MDNLAEKSYTMLTIEDDISAEELIELIRKEDEEFERLKSVCEKEIQKYQSKIDMFNQQRIYRTAEARSLLAQYCREKANKKTKTSEQYRLPSANLKWKKQAPEYQRDDNALLLFVKTNLPQFYKTKIVESADWAELKKKTVLIGDDVESEVWYKDEETGELIRVDGVKAIERPDIFEIEVDS